MIHYTVEPISEDVYHTAQRINCSSSPISVSATPMPSQISQSKQTAPALAPSSPSIHSNFPVKSGHVQSIDEDEVQIEKQFSFPRDLIEHAIQQCMPDQPTPSVQTMNKTIDTTDAVTTTDGVTGTITQQTVQPVSTATTVTTATTSVGDHSDHSDHGRTCRGRVDGELIHTDRSAFVLVHAWLGQP